MDALMSASILGFSKIVALLIDRKVDVNAQSIDGNSALMMASFMGHLSVVNTLLQASAKIDLQNKMSKTAQMFAELGGHSQIIKALEEHGQLPKKQANHTADEWIPDVKKNEKRKQKHQPKMPSLSKSATITPLPSSPLATALKEPTPLPVLTESMVSSILPVTLDEFAMLPIPEVMTPKLTAAEEAQKRNKQYILDYAAKSTSQSMVSNLNLEMADPQKTFTKSMKLIDLLFEQNTKKVVSNMWFTQAQLLVMNVGGLLKGSGSHFTVLFKEKSYGQIVRDHGTGPGHDAGKITALSIAPLIRLLNAAGKIPLEYQNDPIVKKAISENWRSQVSLTI
jgi:ankyrin repeat protein